MQPERDSTEDQQPKEQPQAAYPASPLSPSQAPAQPVVTLTPDDVGDTAPLTGDEGTTNDPFIGRLMNIFIMKKVLAGLLYSLSLSCS